jgi:hypothetical protein
MENRVTVMVVADRLFVSSAYEDLHEERHEGIKVNPLPNDRPPP